ncbi:hypothetical protein YC2023_045626 [Brassica napus]
MDDVILRISLVYKRSLVSGHTLRELCCHSSSSRNIVTRIICLRKTTVSIDLESYKAETSKRFNN